MRFKLGQTSAMAFSIKFIEDVRPGKKLQTDTYTDILFTNQCPLLSRIIKQ
jgi:hypothetical protein